MEKPKVLVISTGGTIASKYEVGKGYSPTITAQDLISYLDGLDNLVELESWQFSNTLGFAITPEQILELINMIKLKMVENNYVGAVITQGTASVEETAYLADLLWDINKPLVFTGAMINASERDWDGPRNLYNSVLVAASQNAIGRGVLVCMGGEIHAARDVMKIHKSNLNAFVSANTGPLGLVSNSKVIFYRDPLLRKVFSAKRLETEVDIVKVSLGMNNRLVEALFSNGTKGIIIEGFPGGGGVTPEIMQSIKSKKDDFIFVLTPRSPLGSIVSNSSGGSGPRDLFECGVINGGDLTSIKARILLMVTLPLIKNRSELQEIFHEIAP